MLPGCYRMYIIYIQIILTILASNLLSLSQLLYVSWSPRPEPHLCSPFQYDFFRKLELPLTKRHLSQRPNACDYLGPRTEHRRTYTHLQDKIDCQRLNAAPDYDILGCGFPFSFPDACDIQRRWGHKSAQTTFIKVKDFQEACTQMRKCYMHNVKPPLESHGRIEDQYIANDHGWSFDCHQRWIYQKAL